LSLPQRIGLKKGGNYAQLSIDWRPCVHHDDYYRNRNRPAEKTRRSWCAGLVETVATGCEKELAAYCQGVTPGDGRILACLYAHADKLSGQCEYALYDAAAQLERAVAALAYLVNECDDDLEAYCGRTGRRGAAIGLPGQEREERQQSVQAGIEGHRTEIGA
jgi:hypothetical protein